MRQACVIETHGLSYRQKFLQSYRKANAIMDKLGAQRRTKAVVRATRLGWLRL
jgi:hypothetical protein